MSALLKCRACLAAKPTSEFSKNQRAQGEGRRCKLCVEGTTGPKGSSDTPHPVPEDPPCAVCGRPAPLLCGRCQQVRYCSERCTKAHWKSGHSAVCAKEELSLLPGAGAPEGPGRVLWGESLSKAALVPPDFPISVRPSLESCAATWGRSGRGPGPFFPSCPPWSKDVIPKEAATLFSRAAPGVDPEAFMGNARKQREMDRRWRELTLHAYDDVPEGERETALLPARDHVKRYWEYGWALQLPPGMYKIGDVMRNQIGWEMVDNWIPSLEYLGRTLLPLAVCDRCKRSIRLPDPPECLCGEVYCSIECHDARFSDHRKYCSSIAENNEIALHFTKEMWKEIWSHERQGKPLPQYLAGWVPRPDPRDFEAEARAELDQGVPPTSQLWREEYAYYDKNERAAMRERLTTLQNEARKRAAAGNGPDTEMFRNLNEACVAELSWQFRYYRQLVSSDTAGRCLFKFRMMLVYSMVTAQMGELHTPQLLKNLMRQFAIEATRRGVRDSIDQICKVMNIESTELDTHDRNWRSWFRSANEQQPHEEEERQDPAEPAGTDPTDPGITYLGRQLPSQ